MRFHIDGKSFSPFRVVTDYRFLSFKSFCGIENGETQSYYFALVSYILPCPITTPQLEDDTRSSFPPSALLNVHSSILETIYYSGQSSMFAL